MAGPWDNYAPAAAPAEAPAASDGPWSRYAAPAAPATEAPKAQTAGPVPFEDGQGGTLPDGSSTRDPAVWKRWTEASTPTAAQPAPQKTGFLANVGAGLQEGAASLVNAAADPFGNLIAKPAIALGSGAYNLGARAFGYEPISAKTITDLLDDHGTQIGDRAVAAIDRAGGAPTPADVAPSNGIEQYARAAAQGAAGMGAVNPAGVALGAVTGVGAQAATGLAPDDLKPAAAMVGGVVAGGAASGASRLTQAAVRAPVNALMEYAAPALGSRNALLDSAGAPIMTAGPNPVPVLASKNQARLAGQQIAAAATDLPAVRAALDNIPEPAVPGANPTTFQVTRDGGLGQLENGLARSGPAASAAFRAQADAANDARVRAIDGVAAGDPGAVPAALQEHGANLDAFHAAEQARTEANAQGLVSRTTQQAEVDNAARQQQAGQALIATGGDYPAGSDAQVGQALRDPVAASHQQTKNASQALFKAIDPDGTLAVHMTPISEAGNEITNAMAKTAKPLQGEESAIFDAAKALPEVDSFKELGALRQRIVAEMKVAKQAKDGDPQTVPRLTQLLNSVHEAMDGTLTARHEGDMQAISAGVMKPEDAMAARFHSQVQGWYADRNAEAATGTGGNFSSGSAGNASGGSAAIPRAFRTDGASGGRSGGAAGSSGLPGSEPLTPNFDAAAADRYAAYRSHRMQQGETFERAPGVGQMLKSGPTRGTFATPDSALPNLIVKVGSAGADTAKAYLKAGGTTEQLADAAAFSLRNAAMRDGVLDPGQAAKWMRDRSSFLSQIPDAAARFGQAAETQRAAVDGAKASTVQVADTTKLATQAINDAVARRAAAVKEYQTSVAGKFLGGADPVRQVGSILNSATGEADMAHLAKLTANDPDARAGLQRAIVEHVLTKRGSSMGPASEFGQIHGGTLQTFLREKAPALRQVLDAGQMQALEKVATSLQDSQVSASGTIVQGNSATAQFASNVHAAGGSFMGTFGGKLASAVATSGAAVAGTLLGGAPGAIAGVAAGAAAAALKAMREAGIANVQDLKVQAALNPELARILLTKTTPKNQTALMQAFTKSLGRIALVSSQQRPVQMAQPAQKPNALMH